MDKALFVRAREADFGLVETALKEATAEFEKTAGYPVEAEIDKDIPLGADRYYILIHSLFLTLVSVELLFLDMEVRLSMIIL
jgi:hypothetical protein